MQTSSRTGKLVALMFVVLVIPLAMYGLWKQTQNNTVEIQRVTAQAMDPYVKALQDQNWNQAYHQFTTPEYKQRTDLETFVAGQQINRQELGNIRSITPNADIFVEQTDPRRGTFYRLTMIYDGTQNDHVVVFEFKKQGDVYKIDRTYHNIIAADILEERVY